MTDKEVLQRFKKDFDKIESPDLWDKIQEKQAQIEPVQEVKTKRKNIPLRYALAACFAVLMVGIGMLALVLSKGNDILIEPSEQPSQVSVYSEQPSQASTASEPISTVSDDEVDLIEQLTLKQIYGSFSLSERGEEELETLLVTYHKDYRVYEDDDYLYNFDDQGRLIEMILINHDESDEKIASRSDIEENINKVFQTYFPDININDYQIEIEECPDASPRWIVEARLYESDIIISWIHLTFDQHGKIQFLTLPTITEDVGNISKEQAIQIALEEAQSGKYKFLEFNKEDIQFNIRYKKTKNNEVYAVYMEKIPLNMGLTTALDVWIDIYTGEIVYIDTY